MALTLAIQGTPSSASIVAGQSVTLIAAVTNAGATAVTLASLRTGADMDGSWIVSQPDYLTPNQPVGVGNPVLLPSTTYFFPFRVVYFAPNFAGPSPQAPSGAAGVGNAGVPVHSEFGVNITSVSSDGTVAFVTSSDPVLSAIAPFPVAQGGALQLASGFNLINFFTTYA